MVRGPLAQEVLFGASVTVLIMCIIEILRAHAGARKIASACQVKFSGFRTARQSAGPNCRILDLLRMQLLRPADSDEVARAFRDEVARGSEMMSPGSWC